MPNLKESERRKPLKAFHCVVCMKAIPEDRMIRKSVTCSNDHARVLKLERRRLRDQGHCRFCNRPNTPEERASYAAWRKTIKKPRADAGKKRGPRPAKAVLEAQPENGALLS